MVTIFLITAGASVGAWVWYVSKGGEAEVSYGASQDSTQRMSEPKTSLKLPELGIEITNIPKELSDLEYKANVHGNDPEGYSSANFSTANLSNRDQNCSPTGGVSDIGMLASVKGMYASESYLSYLKQFDDFWLGYEHPQTPCAKDSATEALHVLQANLFQKLVSNPDNLQAAMQTVHY